MRRGAISGGTLYQRCHVQLSLQETDRTIQGGSDGNRDDGMGGPYVG